MTKPKTTPILTEEEIEGLDYSYDGRARTSREVDRWAKKVAADAQAKKIAEWGDEPCPHDKEDYFGVYKKRQCSICWQLLLEKEGRDE